MKTILILMLFLAAKSAAADSMLSVKPAKCVAMNKGQVCYQTLRFNFSAPAGDYCISVAGDNQPLRCWQAVTKARFNHPFASDTSITYELVNSHSKVVARTSVAVAWVYKKSRRRNRWRLF